MNGIISLDTNIFIYYFHENETFGKRARAIFKTVTKGNKKAITSTISLIELLSLRMPDEDVDYLRDLFLQTPNLTIYDVNQEIALEAARIRREYRFRLPDSIQLATALTGKADVFITNDVRLKKFKEVTVKIIGE